MIQNMKHVFEHLGKAPYKYVGYEQMVFVVPYQAPRAGGSCDHCGTGIRHAFWFESTDGKRFKVGSSCVKKWGDAGLRKAISTDEKRIAKEKKTARVDGIKSELLKLLEANKDRLEKAPHPHPYFASQGKTQYDYMQWQFQNAGEGALKKMMMEMKTTP